MEIQGYPNYLIYPDGRVWSKKTNKYLKPGMSGSGYLTVSLRNEIVKNKSHHVHRLVAIHYIPNPDNKPCVDHINRNKTDNRLENLRWVTVSENALNKYYRISKYTGHQNISKDKRRKVKNIVFQKTINGVRYDKCFKTLKEALCYKYIFILKMRAGLI
jgi:hypothetical protein